eukprot:jgi/Hompol1/6506/HPOL_002388-RA
MRSAPVPDAGLTSPDSKTKQEFLDFDPVELAQQLTYREHEMLCAVQPIQFFLRLWCDERNPVIEREVQPVNDIINSFNTMSYWVATEVCTQPELKNRVKVIEAFIKIAKECRKLQNMNTLMAIISGLNLVAVSRLKNTWEAIDAKRVKQLNDLESVLSPTNNFRIYRSLVEEYNEEMVKSRKPYIPILSLFLKDFLFINDGNPKITENGNINVDKLRTLYLRATQVLATQSCSYYGPGGPSSPASSPVQAYCSNLRALKEPALYKYSCLCEPKSGDDQIRLREKWMAK